MTDHPSSSPPAWVRKRDGRLVPFEADRLSRALFAAGDTAAFCLGQDGRSLDPSFRTCNDTANQA